MHTPTTHICTRPLHTPAHAHHTHLHTPTAHTCTRPPHTPAHAHHTHLHTPTAHTCTRPPHTPAHTHTHRPVSLTLTLPLLASLGCSGGSPSIFRICGCSVVALGMLGLILVPLGGIGNGNWSFTVVDWRMGSSMGRGAASLLNAGGRARREGHQGT